MQNRRLVPLTFALCAALACSLTPTDIQVVATPVSLPEPTASLGNAETAAEASPTAVIAPVATLPTPTFNDMADVYAEKTPNGLTLHYADPSTGRELTAVAIDTLNIALAGEAIFFEGENGIPVRASADGQHIPYEVAAPGEESDFYEFTISPDGSTMVWLDAALGEEGQTVTIRAAWNDRDAILPIYQEDLPLDETLRLVRLSEDGSILYFDRREAGVGGYTAFPSRMDLWALDVSSGQVTHLPGEPGCGEGFFCDGRISDDGRYLLRTMHPASGEPEPVVVYDIAGGQVVARFAAQPADEDAAYEVGTPILTPDQRRLVYALAEGPGGEETFRYFLADLATGEQSFLAESGTTPLRPVRWLDDQTLVLTAAPSAFDEWHLDIPTGDLRRISDRLYLGRVTLP